MNVRKTDDFIADVERHYAWYFSNASIEVAERYLSAVEAACTLLAAHPLIGAPLHITHSRLASWRFFVTLRPFQRHILFYEMVGADLVLRRAMHGHRDLPTRLLDPPAAE
jgi:plasmid stabilization system protein ParE